MRLVLFFSSCVLALSGCNSSVIQKGNATGYGGGDPALSLLDSLRESLVISFENLPASPLGCSIPSGAIPGGSEGRPLWSLLHDLSAEQANYCDRFLRAITSTAKVRLQVPVEELFEISDDANLSDEAGIPVKAKTSRSPSGKIIILRSAVESLSKRTLATLLIHELLHKIIPAADGASPPLPNEYIHDETAYGTFTVGRRLLDTLGARLALDLALRENLDCDEGMVKLPNVGLCQLSQPPQGTGETDPTTLPRLHFVGGGVNGTLAYSIPYLRDGSLGPQRLDGNFRSIELYAQVQMTWDLPLGVGDIDGDGRREMLFVNGSGVLLAATVDENGLVEKQRFVDFSAASLGDFQSSQTAIKPIGVGDVDGDGLDDVVVVNTDGEVYAVSINGNSLRERHLGKFDDAALDLTSQSTWDRPIGVGDINGDGKAEILMVNGGGKLLAGHLDANLALYQKEALGFGTDFGLPSLSSASDWDIPVDVVDTDGDGYEDLVFINGSKEVNIVRFIAGQVQYSRRAGVLAELHSDSANAKELGGLWRWWWKQE